MTRTYFITGTGTGVGKTVCSAILAEALGADYWKPVQAGFEDGTDAGTVRAFLENSQSRIHPEIYCLRLPASPHIAARKEGLRIDLQRIMDAYAEIRAGSSRTLLVEGAGGLMVPLNESETILDLIKRMGAEVILVSRNYLGSINHSLLTARVLTNAGIPVRGWLFTDDFMSYEDEISAWTGIPVLARIPGTASVNRSFILQEAHRLRQILVAQL
jgi:dethiobiotin synthetase